MTEGKHFMVKYAGLDMPCSSSMVLAFFKWAKQNGIKLTVNVSEADVRLARRKEIEALRSQFREVQMGVTTIVTQEVQGE